MTSEPGSSPLRDDPDGPAVDDRRAIAEPAPSGVGPAGSESPGTGARLTGAAERFEDLVVRASEVARRLARPLGPAGYVSLGAALVVWLLLPAPVWPDRPPLWSSIVSLFVLAAPGLWLLVHRWWLDRALQTAAELTPRTRETAKGAMEHIRSRSSERRPGGALRQAWRFYRGTVSPMWGHAADAFAVTAPLRPVPLVMTGSALALTLVLLVSIPLDLLIRAVLILT